MKRIKPHASATSTGCPTSLAAYSKQARMSSASKYGKSSSISVSETEMLVDFPYLEAEDIRACLEYAANEVGHPVLVAEA